MPGAIRRLKKLALAPSYGLRIFGGAPVFRSLVEPSSVDPFATAMTNITFSLGPERLRAGALIAEYI